MAEETYELCLDGEGLRIIPVGDDQVSVHILAEDGSSGMLPGEDVLEKSLANPLFLTHTQSVLVPRDNDLKPVGIEKKQILQGISLYIEYGKDWVEDVLVGISEVGSLRDYPVYCADGISWSNRLILGSLSAKLKTLMAAAGDDSCLVVPQVTKDEFDTFTEYVLAKDAIAHINKDVMKKLLKVGELFDFSIRYISLEDENNNGLVDYSAIFTRQREEFIHKIAHHTDLAKFIGRVVENTGSISLRRSQQHLVPELSTSNSSTKPVLQKLSCDQCDRLFDSDADLQTHTDIVHSTERIRLKKTYPCHRCSKMFAFKQNVAKHLRLAHNEKLLCEDGSVSPSPETAANNSPSRNKARKKSKKSAPKDGSPDSQCKLCGIFAKNKRALVQHMQVHYGRVFKCEVANCEAAFTERSKLRRHMVVHTGERRFECEHCHAMFSLAHNLKTHVKMHLRDKVLQEKQISAGAAVKKKLSAIPQNQGLEVGGVDVEMAPSAADDIDEFLAAMDGDEITL